LNENNFSPESIQEEEENEFLTPMKLINMNQNIQEYSTAEKTKFSNKLNDLQKSFVHIKNISNKNISNIKNTSFNKNQTSNLANGINNFLNTSTKNYNIVNTISTDCECRTKYFINSSSKDLNNKENGNISSAFKTITTNNDSSNININRIKDFTNSENKKSKKFNLKFDTINSKTIEENNENDVEEDDDKTDVEKTAKIKYKYINSLFSSNKKDLKDERKNTYFWFAAYDKLMRSKNIKKIFSFYDKEKNYDKGSVGNVMTNTFDSKITQGNYSNKKFVKFYFRATLLKFLFLIVNFILIIINNYLERDSNNIKRLRIIL